MNIKTTFLSILLIVAALAAQAQTSNGGGWILDGIPENAVFSIKESVGDKHYRQVEYETPDGRHSAIWIDRAMTRPDWIFQLGEKMDGVTVVNLVNMKNVTINELEYPKDALKKEIKGTFEATCIVEPDGRLTDIKPLVSVYPSIDAQAMEYLNRVRMTPAKIGGKAVRCRHQVAMAYAIKKWGLGKLEQIFITDETSLPDGVAKRFNHNVTRTETKTYGIRQYNRRTGEVSFSPIGSSKSRQWDISLNVDVPKEDPVFEKFLCKTLFFKGGKTIEQVGPAFAKNFRSKYKAIEFKGVSENDISIKARCVGFKTAKYYSYAYNVTMGSAASHDYCFIYDITGKRKLKLTDVLTPEAIMLLKLGSNGDPQLALSDKFLYVTDNTGLNTTIALSKETWKFFTPLLQSYTNGLSSLPEKLEADDYETSQRIGAVPTEAHQKIINVVLPESESMSLKQYLNGKISIPDSLAPKSGFMSASIYYTIDRTGKMSNLVVNADDQSLALKQNLERVMTEVERWKPLTLTVDGAVASVNSFNYRLNFETDGATDSNGLKVFDSVEQMPSFPGGPTALFEFLSKNIKYPAVAVENGVQGRVIVSFIVECDGLISNAKIVKSVDPSLDKEAKRVIMSMPKWIPGMNNGEAVRVKYTVPVTFRLQ